MVMDILKGGEKIRLTRIHNGPKKMPEKSYSSRVVQILEGNMIKAVIPVDNGKAMVLDAIERYNMEFYTKRGIFQCEGKVVRKFREKISLYVVFELLTEFEKLQRREYYRLECLLDIKFKRSMDISKLKLEESEASDEEKKDVSNAEQKNDAQDSSWKVGIATNISGGGLRFNSREQLNKGERVLVKMRLVFDDMVKEYTVPGSVIVCNEVPSRPGIYEARVQFVDINRQDREDIIRFVFEEERRIRQKKKGWF